VQGLGEDRTEQDQSQDGNIGEDEADIGHIFGLHGENQDGGGRHGGVEIGFAPDKRCQPVDGAHDPRPYGAGLESGHDNIDHQQRPQQQDPHRPRQAAGGQDENDGTEIDHHMDSYNRIHKIWKVYGGIINIGCNGCSL